MSAWATHTSANTCHTFYKVCWQSAQLHQQQSFLTFFCPIALMNVDFFSKALFFHALQNGCGNTAAITEPLSEYTTVLLFVRLWLQCNAFRTDNGTNFPERQNIVCISLQTLFQNFALLCNTWPNKDCNRSRMFCFQLSRYGTHRGNGCGNILFQHRIMLFNHIHECWTAGSCLLLALLIRFHPLCCFCIGGHICTQCHFYQIGKSDLLQGFSPAGNGNTIPKLPFCTRGNHCNDPLSSN